VDKARGNSVSAHERLGIDDREKRGNNKKLRESLISKKLECVVSNFREASNWVSKETGASNWVSIFEISPTDGRGSKRTVEVDVDPHATVPARPVSHAHRIWPPPSGESDGDWDPIRGEVRMEGKGWCDTEKETGPTGWVGPAAAACGVGWSGLVGREGAVGFRVKVLCQQPIGADVGKAFFNFFIAPAFANS
jgi:hypothetical protein